MSTQQRSHACLIAVDPSLGEILRRETLVVLEDHHQIALLRPYVVGSPSDGREHLPDEVAPEEDASETTTHKASKATADRLDVDAFVERHHSDKDAENARAALAIFYARHGRGPLKPNTDLKAIGKETGLILPDRLDMALNRLKHEGNPVMPKTGEGYKITPSGERFLRETYHVTRGTEPSSSPD